MLKNVKVGQYIWTITSGWTKVTAIIAGDCFPVKTRKAHFQENGILEKDDFHPSAFVCNPFDINDVPPCDFKPGEIIMVCDPETPWRPAIFIETEDKHYRVFNSSYCHEMWPQARKLNDKEKGL